MCGKAVSPWDEWPLAIRVPLFSAGELTRPVPCDYAGQKSKVIRTELGSLTQMPTSPKPETRPRRGDDALRIYRRRVDTVIDYISAHSAEPLRLNDLARIAHFSPFHFHRIFRAWVGESLHAFVRRLRLEKAVYRLAHGPKIPLTQLALHCGFSSSSDFSRAFRQAYGFSPRGYSRERFLQNSKIRQDLVVNAGYGFDRSPRGGNPDRFRVRVVDWPVRRIAYVRVIGPTDFKKLLAGFDQLMAWGRARGLTTQAHLVGMSRDDIEITPMRKLRFDWCLVLPTGVEAEGDASPGQIPASRYAVVHCRGDIQKEYRAWSYLYRIWLPSSGYQPTNEPAMEVYRRNPAATAWKTLDLDCYLPIKPLGRHELRPALS